MGRVFVGDGELPRRTIDVCLDILVMLVIELVDTRLLGLLVVVDVLPVPVFLLFVIVERQELLSHNHTSVFFSLFCEREAKRKKKERASKQTILLSSASWPGFILDDSKSTIPLPVGALCFSFRVVKKREKEKRPAVETAKRERRTKLSLVLRLPREILAEAIAKSAKRMKAVQSTTRPVFRVVVMSVCMSFCLVLLSSFRFSCVCFLLLSLFFVCCL